MRRHRLMYAAAMVGLLLLVASMVRAGLLLMGVSEPSHLWWIVTVLGLFLASNACSYIWGRIDASIEHRADLRASRVEFASRSPEAGRPGASLTGVVGNPAEPQLDQRVDLAAGLACLAGADAELAVLTRPPLARVRCWCGHVAPDPHGPGWVHTHANGWTCPCCAGRLRTGPL